MEEKTKKQIIKEAAAQLFKEKGYAATSMRDLAQVVGLKASSLYNHISSKEEILREICFSNARRFLDRMEEIEKLEVGATEKVRCLIRFHIQVATEDITSVTAFNDEWRHLTEPELGQFKALRKDYESRFMAILQQGIDEKKFKAVRPTIALYTFLSAVRWLHDWYQPGKSITVDDLERDITHLLLGGLCE